MKDLSSYEQSEHFTEKERLVLRYTDAMTDTPVEVPDTLFEELSRHFDAPQLVELTSAIAWENFRARFDHAFGVESMGFSEGSFCPLPEGGKAKAAGVGG